MDEEEEASVAVSAVVEAFEEVSAAVVVVEDLEVVVVHQGDPTTE